MTFSRHKGIKLNLTKKIFYCSLDLSLSLSLSATFHLFFISERAVQNKSKKINPKSTSLRVSKASCDALCVPSLNGKFEHDVGSKHHL